MTAYDVHVYIYDLSRGVAKAMSPVFLGKQIDGIWHTGIVVYGQEFFFGGTGGIESCPPAGTILGQPDTKHFLGKTHIPYDMFLDYLGDLATTSYRPDKYHLLDHNCNTFSSEIAQFLTGNDVPSHITGLPAEVMTTPFGQMIRPFIDAMTVQPSGGHTLFPNDSGASTSRAPKSTLAGAAGNNNLPDPSTSREPDQRQEYSIENLKPYIYRMTVQELIWRRPEFDISARDQSLITDLQDYLQDEEPAWAPGRDHLALLRRLVHAGQDRCELCSLEMLASLAAKTDVVDLLLHEPTCFIEEILNLFDGYTFNRKEAVIKLMTNCCSSESGAKLVLREGARGLTTKICVSSLLGDNLDLVRPTITLCYNMTFTQIPEDMELEIGSALLNCVERDIDEWTAHHLLVAILKLIKRNEEIKGLASVIGLNLEMMENMKSARITSLCDNISALL